MISGLQRHLGIPSGSRARHDTKAWSPERRARQAASIRSWQPWRASTGPRTHEGKARSARNALKHGLRSRAHIERLREDRRILALSARSIAAARLFLRTLRAGRRSGPVLTIPKGPVAAYPDSPNWYWPLWPGTGTFLTDFRDIAAPREAHRPLAETDNAPSDRI